MRVEPTCMRLVTDLRGMISLHHIYSKKTAICKPGGRLSLDTESAGTLILNFPVSITEKEMSVV